ncbi:MAG: hypothetical protein EBV06_04350 [Planctomycetia bacterium]|nr:hypothetical protein [Planctomycetia bacterium]
MIEATRGDDHSNREDDSYEQFGLEAKKVDRIWLVLGTECKDRHQRKVDRCHDDQDGDYEIEHQQASVFSSSVLMSKKVHSTPSIGVTNPSPQDE